MEVEVYERFVAERSSDFGEHSLIGRCSIQLCSSDGLDIIKDAIVNTSVNKDILTYALREIRCVILTYNDITQGVAILVKVLKIGRPRNFLQLSREL